MRQCLSKFSILLLWYLQREDRNGCLVFLNTAKQHSSVVKLFAAIWLTSAPRSIRSIAVLNISSFIAVKSGVFPSFPTMLTSALRSNNNVIKSHITGWWTVTCVVSMERAYQNDCLYRTVCFKRSTRSIKDCPFLSWTFTDAPFASSFLKVCFLKVVSE